MSVTIVDTLSRVKADKDLPVMHLVGKVKGKTIDFNLRGPRVGLAHYKLIRDGISQHFFSGNNPWVDRVDTPDTNKRRATVYLNGNPVYWNDVSRRLKQYASDLNKKGIDLAIVTIYLMADLKQRPKGGKVVKIGFVSGPLVDLGGSKPGKVYVQEMPIGMLKMRANYFHNDSRAAREALWKVERMLATGKIDACGIYDWLEEQE